MSTIAIDDKSFDAFVAKHKVAVVYFWASWCGPCKANAPGIEKMSATLGSDTAVGKLQVDNAMKKAQEYNIANVPTALIFVDGVLHKTVQKANAQAIEKALGELPKEQV